MRKKTVDMEQRPVSFRRLAYEALPEMWGFQVLAAVILGALAGILTKIISSVAGWGGVAFTTANMKAFLLSWRAPVVLLFGIALVFCYVVIELFAKIHLCDDILNGRRAGIRREIGIGFRSLRRFFTPTGLLTLLYIFIAVPLCGVGFSISLSKAFYIPNFIMEVILATPKYAIAYSVGMILLIWLGYRSIFILHAVLIDGMTPGEGRKASVRIIKQHGRKFVGSILKLLVILLLIQGVSYLLFGILPEIWAAVKGQGIPHDYVINLLEMNGDGFTDVESQVLSYRVYSALFVLMGSYLNGIVVLLCGAYFMLRFTRYYLEFTRGDAEEWPERPKKSRYRRKLFFMILVFLLVAAASVAVGLFYNQFLERAEPVKIIAHRAGGTMASENSLEGLYAAIEQGCYASEIDVQRTLDGYYVINHDDDFQRLTGVARAPKDMTLEEIRELRIADTTGSGAELSVVTLEEMLDVIKGQEKLFIELKGATADQQMVDDVVRIVREKDCVSDVALISLNYDVINYAETAYPEFETGTLFFVGLGDVSRLNCDLLIMEEEIANEKRISEIHAAEKQAIVWTVNTEESMHQFLDSSIDAIITDEILLAERVQAELDKRTEFQVMKDKLGSYWQ